ncbi:MAG: T9SS type A sorting domain-containing protein, partial [Lentimicrobiaceae bacterium]|nr:T9SS type A sorting domain-containing protein [Lentimicrobiaceae bacterium]
ESPSIAYINTFANINSNAKIYAPVIWESFTNIPEDKLVKMPTFVGQQTTGNGQQTSSTGWVFPEGQTEISAEDHVAINAPLVLGQQTTDNSQQTLSTLTVKSFGYCGDGTTTNGSITIEEGGQLYCETARGEVTVRKEIIGYAGQKTESKWYTISSPLKDVTSISSVSGLLTTESDYDFYRYDESTHTWQNAKPGEGSTNFQTIELGRGYLYANAENTTLEFTGNINTEDVNYTLTADGEKLTGFHLVGNPYTHDISFNHLSADAELANGYYVLNGEGAWGAALGSNAEDVIKVGQGALIKTTSDGTLTIGKELRATSNEQKRNGSKFKVQSSKLTISVSNSTYSDKAFVVFDEGVGLDKINHENENIPLLYIPQDDTDYAIAMMDENVIEIPVSFEAMTMGQYTISLQQENCGFEELYLLDKETGEKVNILEEDYTFMATTADNAERFVLLKDNGQQTTDNSHFAYQSGEDLIINVEGAVQIIDVMGRIIYSNDVTSDNNRIDVSGFDNAAYIVRVVNEEGVKVQKLIVNSL